jgi:uncharacterized protein (TIGR02246 family)
MRMPLTDRLSMLAIAFAIIGSTADVVSTGQPQDARADEMAIREVIAGTTDAFNKHDVAAFVRFYTPDADLVTVRGESMRGATDIERGLSRIFATRAQHVTLKTLHVRVRFIRRDIAVAHVNNELSGLIGPDGGSLPAHRELSIRVFVKDDGVWRVSAFHNTIVATQSASGAAQVPPGASRPSSNESQRTRPAQAMGPRR